VLNKLEASASHRLLSGQDTPLDQSSKRDVYEMSKVLGVKTPEEYRNNKLAEYYRRQEVHQQSKAREASS